MYTLKFDFIQVNQLSLKSKMTRNVLSNAWISIFKKILFWEYIKIFLDQQNLNPTKSSPFWTWDSVQRLQSNDENKNIISHDPERYLTNFVCIFPKLRIMILDTAKALQKTVVTKIVNKIQSFRKDLPRKYQLLIKISLSFFLTLKLLLLRLNY